MDRLATDLASLRFKPSIRDTGKRIAGVVASASGAHGAIMLKMSSNSAVRSAAAATAAAATSGSLLVGRRWGLAYLPLLLLRLLRRPRSVADGAAAADLGKHVRYQAIIIAVLTSSVPPRLAAILDGASEGTIQFHELPGVGSIGDEKRGDLMAGFTKAPFCFCGAAYDVR